MSREATGRNGEAVDLLLAVTYAIVKNGNGPAYGANDGLVTVETAKWGTWLGEINADHLDEVGQLADLLNLSFNHLDFYEGEIVRLHAAGH